MLSKKIIWENNGRIIDSFIISTSEDVTQTHKYILEALTDKFNPVVSVNWSDFGNSGDTIRIENIPLH